MSKAPDSSGCGRVTSLAVQGQKVLVLHSRTGTRSIGKPLASKQGALVFVSKYSSRQAVSTLDHILRLQTRVTVMVTDVGIEVYFPASTISVSTRVTNQASSVLGCISLADVRGWTIRQCLAIAAETDGGPDCAIWAQHTHYINECVNNVLPKI